MRLCVVCWCRVVFDVAYCVFLLFLVGVGVVCSLLLFVGCCMLSTVVLRGPLFVVGMRC